MGLITNVLIFIIVVTILYWIFSWFTAGGSTKLSGMMNGKQASVLTSQKLPVNSNTSNFTYSTWIYVDDWNYRFGEQKIIIGRKDASGAACPIIKLSPVQNNLDIDLNCYGNTSSAGSHIVHTCSIDNIPLQKWVNIIVSVNGRTMDVYINGKLVKTCVLPGVAKVEPTAPVSITPDGGFSGFTSETTYRAEAIDPQQAWNIYKKGFGGNLLGNLFNKYRIRVSFLEDNVSQGSFEL